jgi:uncharacterized membrane protein (DUF2068 family)
MAGKAEPGSSRGAPPEGALRAIVGYKSIKAALQLSAALLLAAWWPLGLPELLIELSAWLRRHLTHAWAAWLSDLLVADSLNRRILLSIVALALDGSLTALEAWSLYSGRWWGPWLVVAATGALLPFELYEFVRVPRLSRALLFALNLLILAYLARRAWREHRRALR